MLSLTVERRQEGERGAKNDILRKAGKIPAVFYGPKEASAAVAVNLKEFTKVWKKAGESSVIILKDGTTEHEALIHEVDKHPLTGEPRHADFYVIEKGKKVTVSVPLVFAGISPAVKDKGGILVKVHREMEVEAGARDLPHELIVDMAKLVELNSVIHAKDIVLPSGVDLKINPEEVIASVAEFKEEAVEAPTAIDMSSIEVEAKGKEVKEGEAPAAGALAGDAKAGGGKLAGDAKKAEGKK